MKTESGERRPGCITAARRPSHVAPAPALSQHFRGGSAAVARPRPLSPRSFPSCLAHPRPLHRLALSSIAAHRLAVHGLLSAVTDVDLVSSADTALLRAQIGRLDDSLFLLCVVGEYNSGKSSLINALLGRRVVAEGVVPTTAEVTVLRYADGGVGESPPAPEGVVVLAEDVEMLKTVSLVDSPGTNAIDRRHEALTKEYLPLCDLVLFVTSADRPFSESERLFLQSIRAWGKKCVLLINKADLLADGDARAQVVDFVRTSSRALLGRSPEVFTVSSRQALQAKEGSTAGRSGDLWEASGFEPLEMYISQNLDADERLRIKLASVASVASTVGEVYVDRLAVESAVIEADNAALSTVADLVAKCDSTIELGFPAHFARVDNVLLEFLERADMFFDSHVTFSNMTMLLKKDAVARAFIDEVVLGTERDVERRARSLAEWVSEKLSRNVAEVTSIFSRRVGERKAELVAAALKHEQVHNVLGDIGEARALAMPSSADVDVSGGDHLMSGLGDAAAKLAASYKPETESQRVADALSASVKTALALEIGAVGAVGAFLSISALDFTAIASTGMLVTAGLVVLPQRRRAMRAEMRVRVASMRARLEKDLHARVGEQMALHSDRIQGAIEPFANHTAERAGATASQSRAITQSLEGLTTVRNVAQAADALASAANEAQSAAPVESVAIPTER